VMVYFVQRGDAESFTLAHDIDPAYARAFTEAANTGVEAIAVVSALTLEGLALPRAIALKGPPAFKPPPALKPPPRPNDRRH